MEERLQDLVELQEPWNSLFNEHNVVGRRSVDFTALRHQILRYENGELGCTKELADVCCMARAALRAMLRDVQSDLRRLVQRMWISSFQFTRAVSPNQADEAWPHEEERPTLRTGQRGLQTEDEAIDERLFSGDFVWRRRDLDKELGDLKATSLPLAFCCF